MAGRLEQNPTGKLVVGVDGSAASHRALDWAARQAPLTSATLGGGHRLACPAAIYSRRPRDADLLVVGSRDHGEGVLFVNAGSCSVMLRVVEPDDTVVHERLELDDLHATKRRPALAAGPGSRTTPGAYPRAHAPPRSRSAPVQPGASASGQ